MDNLVYDYLDYKKYLIDKLSSSKTNRGLKKKMANFIGCQPAFLSQVLRGVPHLSLEHAVKINLFFEHTDDESRAFIFLVEYNRAGSSTLKKHFLGEIERISKKRHNLNARLTVKTEIPENHKAIYYSAWYYSAIHILSTISSYQTVEAIGPHLKLSRQTVLEALEFLTSCGFVVQKGDRFEGRPCHLHLSRDSSMIRRHHSNWRMQALCSIENNFPDDLHFSTVASVAKKDISKIKELFVSAIERSRTTIRSSKEEEIVSICVDVFTPS